MCRKLSFLISVVLVLGPVAGTANAVLVSHWKFDEGQGNIAYDSVGNNHGTIYGAQWTTGQVGGALKFDGVDDYVLVSDSPHLNPSSAISIEAWIKPKIVNKFQRVISKDNFLEGKRDYLLQVTETAGLKFVIWTPERVLVEGGTITAGEWHHVAGTYDGTMAKAWIDGSLVASASVSGALVDTDAPVLIGEYRADSLYGDYHEAFDGIIDEVRIYDHAIPEPATLLLLGLGGLALLRRRRR